MLNSGLSPAAPQGGREPPTDKIRVVSTRRRVPTNWVFGRTLQPSIESVVAIFFCAIGFPSGWSSLWAGDCAPPSHRKFL